MILLDTHIWVWWVHDHPNLKSAHREQLRRNQADGLGVSVISCWEVAKLVEFGRLVLPTMLDGWMDQALAYPGIRLLNLTPRIAIESSRLTAPFPKDPADQIIVATAREYGCELATLDDKIRRYGHVKLLR